MFLSLVERGFSGGEPTDFAIWKLDILVAGVLQCSGKQRSLLYNTTAYWLMQRHKNLRYKIKVPK